MMADTQNMAFYHHTVATSFICRLDNDSFKTLKVGIFKRTSKVKTHQGLWSAISGSIEPGEDSLHAAWRELEEETGLTKKDLCLLHSGKPHDVVAKDLSRKWTIHPFAFVLKPGHSSIILNWENNEFRFVDPEEVETYNTVPDLDITLWRTLVGPDTASGLQALRDDTQSGARSLATKAVRILLMAVTGSDLDWSTNVKSCWRAFRLVAWHLSFARPCMGAAIERAVLHAVALANPGIEQAASVNDARQILIEACSRTLNERLSGRDSVGKEFVKYLYDPAKNFRDKEELTFLTHSFSCAKVCLLELARRVKTQRIHVIILESRPSFEGVRMAIDLDRQWRNYAQERDLPVIDQLMRVTVAADAAIGSFAREVDCVLLGCDRIYPDGAISNKVGSLGAALSTKALSCRNVTVLALAETEKISRRPYDDTYVGEQFGFWDLANDWHISQSEKEALLHNSNIQVATPVFETVPSKYIDSYITEKGPLSWDNVAELSGLAAKEWDEVFESL